MIFRNFWQLVPDFVFMEGKLRTRIFPQSIVIFSETFLIKVLRQLVRQLIHKIVFAIGIIHLERTQIFRKTNISYPLKCTRTCAYQEVKIASFSENLDRVLNDWSHTFSYVLLVVNQNHTKNL